MLPRKHLLPLVTCRGPEGSVSSSPHPARTGPSSEKPQASVRAGTLVVLLLGRREPHQRALSPPPTPGKEGLFCEGTRTLDGPLGFMMSNRAEADFQVRQPE